jgi:hypothetical protein
MLKIQGIDEILMHDGSRALDRENILTWQPVSCLLSKLDYQISEISYLFHRFSRESQNEEFKISLFNKISLLFSHFQFEIYNLPSSLLVIANATTLVYHRRDIL